MVLRGYFGIASLCLLPLFAHNASKHKAAIAVSAGLALIALNPVIVYLVAQIAWSLAWRLQWLLPVAGTVALGIFLVADFIARGKPTFTAAALRSGFDRICHARPYNIL